MIGEAAENMNVLGHARFLSKEEFLGLLDRAENEAMVLNPENTKNPQFICCCCGDCCELLINLKKLPKPTELVQGNYQAVVSDEKCTGCKICVKRCQMEAVSVDGELATVNLDRCIGCGNCVPTCGMKAMKLYKNDRNISPPKSSKKMYIKMMIKKRGFFGTLKMAANMLFGRKV